MGPEPRLWFLCAIYLDLAQTIGKASQINAAASEINPVLSAITDRFCSGARQPCADIGLPLSDRSAIVNQMTVENNHDAYKPATIAALVEGAGVAKAHLPAAQMFVLAILAGVFIGFGAAAYTTVMTGADAAYGLARLLGGVVFSLGLILVIIGGAELFTGKALMVMAAVARKITLRLLLRSWAVVYVGTLSARQG